MSNSTFYTKGEPDKVFTRVNQIHTITLYCPMSDYGVQCLKHSFELMLSKYRTTDSLWSGVSSTDALNVFLFTTSFNTTTNVPIDMTIVGVIMGSLKQFPKLKYINFDFTDDFHIMDIYKDRMKGKKDVPGEIYKIEKLELNLSDMFSQEIIDFFNRVMAMNEIISNSYLERKFKIDFKYDEYISFMDMFLGNNGPILNQKDGNICNYFRAFPVLVEKHKPDISVITNYINL